MNMVRSPSKANLKRQSPIKMLTKSTPDLRNIVAFGSTCTVHRYAQNKSLGERGKQGFIIGKSDEMKGYRVFIPKDKIVIVTQHVRNVETLVEERNGESLMEKRPASASVKGSKRRGWRRGWTRDAHRKSAAVRMLRVKAE